MPIERKGAAYHSIVQPYVCGAARVPRSRLGTMRGTFHIILKDTPGRVDCYQDLTTLAYVNRGAVARAQRGHCARMLRQAAPGVHG